MGVNQNTTIVFPLPIDMIERVQPAQSRARRAPRATGGQPRPEPPPEVRIDHRSTGLRAPRSGSTSSPGCGRSSPRTRSHAATLRSPTRGADAAEACPFCEGREDRTPPEVWAGGPAAAEPTARAGRRARSPTSTRRSAGPRGRRRAAAPRDLDRERDRSRSPRRRAAPSPTSSGSQPAAGGHEVIVNCARARDLARRRSPRSGWRRRSRPGESGCAPTPTPPTCT